MNSQNQAEFRDGHSTRLMGERENKIVSAAQKGSHTAFADLYKLYARRLYYTIFSITKSPEDAEDALQETFLRAHRAIRTFEGRSSVFSWLMRIAVNSALMTLRKRRSRLEILFDPSSDGLADKYSFDLEDSAPGPERLCDMSQRWLRLLQALGELDESLSGPIWMQITKGASVKEIGRTFDLTDVAVKVRLHRARLRLSAACRAVDKRAAKSFKGKLQTAAGKTGATAGMYHVSERVDHRQGA
jgi:RNA polymerase sigma-70 factor, ECF subfamily